MSQNVNKNPDFNKMAKVAMTKIVRMAKVEGVRYFKQSFRKQGFTDRGFEPWQPIKKRLTPSRAILINSGFLRDSIQVFDSNDEMIVFGSDAPYAKIHNEGGVLKIRNTDKSRRFFWFMWYRTKDTMWKNMALSRKSHFMINMPKRQFIGESQKLLEKIDNRAVNIIQKAFKTN